MEKASLMVVLVRIPIGCFVSVSEYFVPSHFFCYFYYYSLMLHVLCCNIIFKLPLKLNYLRKLEILNQIIR